MRSTRPTIGRDVIGSNGSKPRLWKHAGFNARSAAAPPRRARGTARAKAREGSWLAGDSIHRAVLSVDRTPTRSRPNCIPASARAAYLAEACVNGRMFLGDGMRRGCSSRRTTFRRPPPAALAPGNLDILTDAMVREVLVEGRESEGHRLFQPAYRVREKNLRAACAGAALRVSPHLLISK